MEVIDFLRICREFLKVMSRLGLKSEDYRYIEMYEEYRAMRDRKEKVEYILKVLSDKYKVSESTVKRIVRRFNNEVR